MKNPLKTIFSVNSTSLACFSTLAAALLFLLHAPFLDLVELKTYDLRLLYKGNRQPSEHVVMAVIDEKSLDKEGRWPWPRSKIASLVDRLNQDGAKVIGFDIGFLEPDENSRLQFLSRLQHQIRSTKIKNRELEKIMEKRKARADNDRILAESLKKSDARVVLGYFFHMSEDSLDYQLRRGEIKRRLSTIVSSKYPAIMYKSSEARTPRFIKAAIPETNLDVLTRASDSSGYFNILPDRDGVVRALPLIIKCGREIFPPFAVLCAWHYLDRPQLMVKVADYEVMGVHMGEKFLPSDGSGQMLVNYLGPPKTFPCYSITDILDGKVPPGTFKNRVVLVGSTAVGLHDSRSTPVAPVFPGIEIHATVIDNILGQDFLRRPNWVGIYDLFAVIALGLLAGFLLPRLNAINGALFALALFITYILFAHFLFVSSGIWINIVYPLLSLSLTFTAVTVYRYFTEERERKKIRSAFKHYVSDSVVNEMLKDPERLKLGGEKRELTVLFSDIRGFTTISEGLSPEELTHLLNEYMTAMTNVVFKYHGTLDKYIGDALMAIYGAPLDLPDHASRACRSALDMVEGLKTLNEKWDKEGKNPLSIGIGVNTGVMMVGNMGSQQRFDYTVMGDAVNLGSRLEGANKDYGTNILISESTYEWVRDVFICVEVDSVRVKGKTMPVKIYQLIGYDGVSELQKQAVVLFEKGLHLYKNRRWDEAIEVFHRVKDLSHGIGAPETYIQRSLQLKADPPPPEWDGVFTMRTK